MQCFACIYIRRGLRVDSSGDRYAKTSIAELRQCKSRFFYVLICGLKNLLKEIQNIINNLKKLNYEKDFISFVNRHRGGDGDSVCLMQEE